MNMIREHSLKRLPRTRLLAVQLAVCAIISGCAGGGGSSPDSAPEPGGGQTITLWTDSLELFLEHPPLVASVESDVWAIHLNWLSDWQPVREGSLELQLLGDDGRNHTFSAAAPARPGIFTPRTTLPTPGRYQATLTLEARGRAFPIEVGGVQVYASESDLPEASDEEPSGRISFLKEQQWEIPFAVETTETREIRPSLNVTGLVEAPPDRIARISAPVSGIVAVEGAENVGSRVAAGQTLAVLEPTEGASSYTTLRADVDRLTKELERAERLYAAGAVPERRVIALRRELDVASAILSGVSGPETGADMSDGAYRFRLRSPIAGIVVERLLSPGQRVQTGQPAFTVLDGRTLWLRLNVPAGHAVTVSGAVSAAFVVEGGQRVRETTGLVSVGSMLDPETRTLPVVLRFENPTGDVKVGMLADARLFVDQPESGVAVPDEAIHEHDGLHVAYVEVGGESFERRVLDLGPGDGAWTIVRRGLESGERVVTRGAYQIRLASLGDAEPAAHGHAH